MKNQSAAIVTSDGFLREGDIIGGPQPLLPISRFSWRKGVRSGYYPPPFKIGPKCTGYRIRHVQKLLSYGPALDQDGNVIDGYWEA